MLKENMSRHVDWNGMFFGAGNEMSCIEADEIIEEIMSVLISRKLTIEESKRLLSETISSIDKEFVLEKRKIANEVI